MTPDKIYFPADGLPAYIDWDGSPISTKPVGDNDICYIRKDTLIDLIMGYSHPLTKVVMRELIEKINEL